MTKQNRVKIKISQWKILNICIGFRETEEKEIFPYIFPVATLQQFAWRWLRKLDKIKTAETHFIQVLRPRSLIKFNKLSGV